MSLRPGMVPVRRGGGSGPSGLAAARGVQRPRIIGSAETHEGLAPCPWPLAGRLLVVGAQPLWQAMTVLHPVALLGLSPFECSALQAAFRLSAGRAVAYEAVERLEDCRFAVVDTDTPGLVEAVRQARRLRSTVFIGPHAPGGAQVWLMRPLDPAKVVHELDLLDARDARETAPVPLLGDGAGLPLPPGLMVPAADGRPLRADALGRREGDTLGGPPVGRRSDRRS